MTQALNVILAHAMFSNPVVSTVADAPLGLALDLPTVQTEQIHEPKRNHHRSHRVSEIICSQAPDQSRKSRTVRSLVVGDPKLISIVTGANK